MFITQNSLLLNQHDGDDASQEGVHNSGKETVKEAAIWKAEKNLGGQH